MLKPPVSIIGNRNELLWALSLWKPPGSRQSRSGAETTFYFKIKYIDLVYRTVTSYYRFLKTMVNPWWGFGAAIPVGFAFRAITGGRKQKIDEPLSRCTICYSN